MVSNLERAFRHDRTSRYTVNPAKTIKSAAANHVAAIGPPPTAYNGTCDMTMMRGSVISSMAYFSPSRPNPESFAPP